MVYKTLIDLLFSSEKDVIMPKKELSDRIERSKTEKYQHLDSEGFLEYLTTGHEPQKTNLYGLSLYLEQDFENVTRPEVGDVVVIQDSLRTHTIYFKGIIVKEEGRTKNILYKSGKGPYALFEEITLQEAKKGYQRPKTHTSYYRLKNKELPAESILISQPVENINYNVA